MFLQKFMDLIEVENAVVILHAFIFMAGALMLLVGVTVVDMVCIFLFIIFGFGAILAKIAVVVIFMIGDKRENQEKIWVAAYSFVLFVFHVYVMLVAYSLGKRIWQKHHHHVRLSVRLHRWGHHRHHPILGA
ncbi:hypothetical protein HHI36_001996 [Cryptolaemus montrouzieri]